MLGLENILTFFVGFTSGFLLGTISTIYLSKKIKITPSVFVLIMVVSVWAITRLVDILNPAFTTPLALDGLVGAIVGFFYRPIKNGNLE